MITRKPITPEMVEVAARALYEGPDQFGRKSGVTWEQMLTYGGAYPDNTEHPFADEYRRMAMNLLEAVLLSEGEPDEVAAALRKFAKRCNDAADIYDGALMD